MLAPAAGLKRPTSQGVQKPAPAPEYAPMGHATQVALPVPFWKVPAGQGAQLDMPAMAV